MKKFLSINLMLAAAFALVATSAFAGPSRSFIQELGQVQANKEVTIDLSQGENPAFVNIPNGNAAAYTSLLNSNFLNFQVNVGAFGGEVRVGKTYESAASQFGLPVAANFIGYKAVVIPNLSVYADIGYINGTPSPAPGGGNYQGETDLKIGGAYTLNLMPVILNINPEYTSMSASFDGGSNTPYVNSIFAVNAAVLLPVATDWILGVEYLYDSYGWAQSSTNQITSSGTLGIGVRWKANSNVTLDGIVYANASASGDNYPGGNPSYSAFGVPALLKVNIKL